MKQIKTPCIGICSTTSFGDKICRGCKRFSIEVINWNTYADHEKLAVLSRIDQLTTQIMQSRFRIYSVPKLQQVMTDFRIFYDDSLSPYCWLHNFLQKHFHRITDLNELGVELQPRYRQSDVRDLILIINDELIVLSEAHFERYFNKY